MYAETDWKNNLQEIHRESYLWSLTCCDFDEDLARDVLQTVYLKIYEGKASFHNKSALKTWFFSVIRFTSIDYIRKYRKHTEQLDDHHRLIAEPEQFIEIHDRKLFIKILQGLSVQQREVLTLAFYHDLTMEEIAVLLKLSIGSVRTHYARGKANFKKLFNAYKSNNDLL